MQDLEHHGEEGRSLMASEEAERAKRQMKAAPVKTAPDWSKGLSTGSTLLNLACSGRTDVGFLPGRMYFWVGDSGSGKTMITMSCFAEASINPAFDEHRFIFDNPEQGADMDWARFFGKKAAERIEPPRGTRKDPLHSDYLERYYHSLDDAFESGKPFISLLDSMDALPPYSYWQRHADDRKAMEKGTEVSGSYGTEKARINSDKMRLLFNNLKNCGRSIVFIISQTRDNIGFGAQFNPKTRGGGRALKYYSGVEIWTSVMGHVHASYAGKKVEKGIRAQLKVKKNRLSGKEWTVNVPILHDSGIDDVGSCVDFLVEWRHWKKEGKEDDNAKGKITAPEFNAELSRERLIQLIQERDEEKELRTVVAGLWKRIEDETRLTRKNKYDQGDE
jgi:RecA/RadA recombinase